MIKVTFVTGDGEFSDPQEFQKVEGFLKHLRRLSKYWKLTHFHNGTYLMTSPNLKSGVVDLRISDCAQFHLFSNVTEDGLGGFNLKFEKNDD